MHLVMLAEAGGEAASGGVGAAIDQITSLVPKAVALATTAWDFAMSNPYTAVGVIAGFVTIGVGIIATIKNNIH